MEYEKLKGELKEIAAIAQLVPDPFKEKCFEMLLGHLLAGVAPPRHKPPAAEIDHKHDDKQSELKRANVGAGDGSAVPLPASVKAFMRRTGTTKEQIEAVVMIADGEFHFVKEPSHQNVTKGQNEWALLIALRNGILNNTLAADPEDVRSMVQEKGFYDKTNFSKNFKRDKYAAFYKDAMERQGPAVPLSAEGEKELADLLRSLAGTVE
jgi:hypothetical protein